MKFLRNTLAALALSGLTVAPIAAQAAPAQVAPVRTAAATEQTDQLHGHVGPLVVIVGLAAALGLLLWAVGVFDDGKNPTSP